MRVGKGTRRRSGIGFTELFQLADQSRLAAGGVAAQWLGRRSLAGGLSLLRTRSVVDM